MNPKLLLLAVLCLFLFALMGYAQQGAPQQGDFWKMQTSPMGQLRTKSMTKAAVRSCWDGWNENLMVVSLLNDPNIRDAWNISDEQFRQIQDADKNFGGELMKNPEFLKTVGEMRAIQKPDDPFMENADEETKTMFQDVQERMAIVSIAVRSDAVVNLLTPEQKQKVREAQLANMSEMPIITPNMFVALNLTDAQKQQMEKIKKELEPEFEKHLESFANGQMIVANKVFEELEKQGGDEFSVMTILREKGEATLQKMLADDPALKKVYEDTMSQGKAFSTQFQTKMFDVLTDEQWTRLQKLIDNPPEHAKAFGKKLKEQSGVAEKSGAWQPGPNSWRPGDPIPAGYLQQREERQGRFPRSGSE
jgi:Spy/CpxP family protein refolding chaperone